MDGVAGGLGATLFKMVPQFEMGTETSWKYEFERESGIGTVLSVEVFINLEVVKHYFSPRKINSW